MRWILDNSNPSKQMIVTTATVPSNVQFVIDRYMKYHEYIDLGAAVRGDLSDILYHIKLYTAHIPQNDPIWIYDKTLLYN